MARTHQYGIDESEYMVKNIFLSFPQDYLTDEIRNIMKQRPGTRTEDQIIEVATCRTSFIPKFDMDWSNVFTFIICVHKPKFKHFVPFFGMCVFSHFTT